MGDSRAHVEASGGRPQGRLSAAVRHRRRSRVRHQPAAPPPSAAAVPGGGLDALGPRSRRPHTSPGRTSDAVRDRIIALRTELTARGLDAGPVTIAWHLEREGLPSPVDLDHPARPPRRRAGRRPSRASARAARGIRFEAAAPNEVWQSDFTHWRLADGSEVEICSWLDDHSRYLLALHRLRAGRRRRRGGHVHRGRRRARLARRHAHRQRVGLHVALHRRPQRLRVPARLPRHPPEERGARPSPDPGQDRALPPDPQALARAAAGGRSTSPSCRPSSTPSASPTTSSGPTGRSAGSRRARRTGRHPRRMPSGPAHAATSASATTSPTARAR